MANTLDDLLGIKPKSINADVRPSDIQLVVIGNEYTKITQIVSLNKGAKLYDWVNKNLKFVKTIFAERKAVLFSDFGPVISQHEFSDIVASITEKDLLKYSEPSTPRTELLANVYTSTEYPSEEEISQHNEHSYSTTWPRNIAFYCAKAAESGGETPVCDSRAVYKLIPSYIVKAFESSNAIQYVRNFSNEMDINWRTFFGTSEKEAVEVFCKEKGIDFEWRGTDEIRTSHLAPCSLYDKETDERIWFNQAHLFHSSNLNPEILAYLEDVYGMDNLPRDARHGDGSIIESGHLTAIREAYNASKYTFQWSEGDLLLLDNVRYTHGRAPFSGERRIWVAMSGEESLSDYQVFKNESQDVELKARRDTANFYVNKFSRTDSREMIKYKLAVACRLMNLLNLDEGSVSGHISAKVPGSHELFWVNPFGLLFEEVLPSDLILVNKSGEILEGEYPINLAGFCLHSAIHCLDSDVGCVVHTHSPWGTAFSALADPKILPLDQNCCMFYNKYIVNKEFDGPVNNFASATAFAKRFAGNQVAILANHGTVTCGSDVDSAIMYTVSLERALRLNLLARQTSETMSLISKEIARDTSDWISNPLGFKIEFDAMTRKAERKYPELLQFRPEC